MSQSSPNAKKPEPGSHQQRGQRNKAALWFKTVFMKRKEYVPGDTFRFFWQTVPEIKGSFVLYRLGHMIGILLIFIVSFFHISLPYDKVLCEKPFISCPGQVVRIQFEWFFYATSLGLMVNLVQAVLGLGLTVWEYRRQSAAANAATDVESRGQLDRSGQKKTNLNNKEAKKASDRSQKSPQPDAKTAVDSIHSRSSPKKGETKPTPERSLSPPGKPTKEPEKSSPERGPKPAVSEHRIFTKTGIYWGLHTYSLCACFIIDVVYWVLIWPGLSTYPRLIFIQFDEHLLNLPLMMTDYALVAFPVIPSHLWCTGVISSSYVVANVLYYLAGGKDEKCERPYLYSFLNWQKPGKALAYSFFVTLSMCIVSLIFLVVDHYKFKLRPKALLNPAQNNQSKT